MEGTGTWTNPQRNLVIWMVALASIIELWMQGFDAILQDSTDRFWMWTAGAILVAAIAFHVESLKLRGDSS